MEIILDTNALIYAARNKIDIQQILKQKFGMLGIYVPNLVIDELKEICKSAVKAADREAASIAYQIIKKKGLSLLKLHGPTDHAIAEYAAEKKAAVLTNDLALKWILREKGVKVYNIRQNKYIEEW